MYDFDIIHYAHGDEFFFILTASQSVRWVSVVVFCCFFVIFLGGGGGFVGRERTTSTLLATARRVSLLFQNVELRCRKLSGKLFMTAI